MERTDLLVPLDYGIEKSGDLPQATKKALSMARYALRRPHGVEYIAWANSDYFTWDINFLQINKENWMKASGFYIPPKFIYVPCKNSITEARNIRDILNKKGFSPKYILVICDAPHAPRTKKIWEHFFPDSEIQILITWSDWDENHPSIWQKSKFRWLFGNILHHMAISLFGIERLANKTHTLK